MGLTLNFNPRSYKRSDNQQIQNYGKVEIISIHAPTRGATERFPVMLSVSPNFNPRSYKRSDVKKVYRCIMFSLFQSTLLQEERLLSRLGSTTLIKISIHAPTRGATGCNISGNNISLISIHAPTRGATLHEYYNVLCFYISIHAPTRGATSNGGNVS